MAEDDLVLRSDDDGVTTLTLNRPDKLNALDPRVMTALRGHVNDLAADRSVVCVVLTGAGRSFCSGHDLEVVRTREPTSSPFFEAETIDALERLPLPTIAKIRGHCFTGGLELALACDLLIAAESAQLADTHGQWGLVPVWGMSVRLPERVGSARAKELMFTSRRISGVVAASYGLVDRCVADDQLDTAVSALVEEIRANSPGTNRICKQLLAAHAQTPRGLALELERAAAFGRPDDTAERLTRGARR
jgi:enoyl-CoA hydratase